MGNKALFQACSCGKHGRLVIDDSPGDEFFSKTVGHMAVVIALEKNKIDKTTHDSLLKAIGGSTLCCRSGECDGDIVVQTHEWNMVRRIQSMDPTEFHEYFKSLQ